MQETELKLVFSNKLPKRGIWLYDPLMEDI